MTRAIAYAEDKPASPGPATLAIQGAVFALWLAAGFALGAYSGSDRYPTYGLGRVAERGGAGVPEGR